MFFIFPSCVRNIKWEMEATLLHFSDPSKSTREAHPSFTLNDQNETVWNEAAQGSPVSSLPNAKARRFGDGTVGDARHGLPVRGIPHLCRSHRAAWRGTNGPGQTRAELAGSASTCCALRKVTLFIKAVSNSVTSLSSAPSRCVKEGHTLPLIMLSLKRCLRGFASLARCAQVVWAQSPLITKQ